MSEAEDAQKLSAPEAPPDAPAPATAPALNADGRERPQFLLEFPRDPALQQLVAAFEAGNYQAVREGAAKLAESTEDPIVAAAARELARRIEPDPLMKYLLFVALGLFMAVVWYAYQGPH
ncbi:MAG TPA: hypothetical protein VER96_35325 [Polyangiaceae bacterium]|nr:hypothetical protein [Polyangiaceae bacterium]